MPIVLTNWTAMSDPKRIVAWIPENDNKIFLKNRNVSRFSTGRSNTGMGVQKKRNTYYEYSIPLSKCNFDGKSMWTFQSNGENYIIMFASRSQNPNYPSQTLEEIQTILS